MIIMKIEEKENEEVSFKFNEIDKSTDLEKAVLASVLEFMRNDFNITKVKKVKKTGKTE
ncbi:hypothetical protein GQ597_09740 [Gilliamella sp. Pra-s65]|uniref:hypothetical protein n=1 Tax=unclassified Gilliamella TaxID=2685620 RepID=UPI0013659491|nr:MULTISPECIES: hypothetical protein [unclassified Gilliamella]MWN90983.1 hypothetical protein [Gilliamella sp. Pra-s65]MWP73909.1 hypothetical protein [Gilliamella sp. Pra-s52]